MSETATTPPAPAPAFPVVTEPTPPPTSTLLKLSGMLGVVACFTGLAVLLAGCAGRAWYALAPFIALAGGGGVLLALLAAAFQKRRIGEETHFLMALFVNALAIVGGLVEMALLKGWPLLPK